jgi:hypothetical protein
MNPLEFRRQYLLSNVPLEKIEDWKHLEIPSKKQPLNLYYHPDLEITQVKDKDKSVVLIGYILDPFNPELSNKDIIIKMLQHGSLNEVLNDTENLSGRFAIIYNNGENAYLFHDATGFREIYYSFLNDQIFCGSTPNIINRYTNLELDADEAINAFIHSSEYKSSGFWIGTRTPFPHIFHLLPNFYLDLNKKANFRYWPNEKRKEFGLKEGAAIMAKILQGTMLALTKRYVLYQSLTSGWDTRVLFAASKDVKNQINFLVNKINQVTDKSADIWVPLRIAKRYKINFEVIDINSIRVDEQFRNTIFRNNIFARDTHIRVFYDAYLKKQDNAYWVTGTFGNEILRIAFPYRNKKISALDIARRFYYNKYTYAIESAADWMKDSSDAYGKYGYNVLNLFCWEQYTGNMENLGASEGDIIREEIHPFNCRKLITTYISLNDKYRYKDYPLGHRMIIEILWKELLEFPVDPHTDETIYWFKKATRFLGIELIVDRVYYFFKNNIYYSDLFGKFRQSA